MLERIVRHAALYTLVSLLAIPLAAQIKTESFHGRPVAASEVLVRFNTITPNEVAEAQQAADADVVRGVGGVPRLFRFHSRSKKVAALLNHFRALPNVAYAEPNFIVHASKTPNDPSFPQLWGLQNTGQTVLFFAGTPGADIGAVAAWDITTGSTANAVAVVDTGIDYTHPDLAANVWSAPSRFSLSIGGVTYNCAPGTHGVNVLTGACDPMDDNSHGTHVSGTIGAAGNNSKGVVGVNWTTQLLGAKFLDSSGSGTDADAANAIEFAVQAKLMFSSAANVRVLNASWGGPDFSQALLDEINRASGYDMLFVAAAGNNGTDNDTTAQYPANYSAPNIIAVAATDNADNLAYFSDYGAATVHLGAPGVNIYSTIPGGAYEYLSGTSMAAPHVSGAAALVLSACALDTAGLKAALLNNVDLLASLAGLTITGGRLDVNHALHGCTDAVSLSPSSLSFGNEATAMPSTAQTLTLTNRQLTALNISDVVASGDFTQTNNCGTSLAAGGHCTINVTFAPSVTGYRTGTVTVSDDAQNSPQVANVAGTGVAPVSVTPATLSFSSTVVGSTSPAQTVALTNNQSTALAISSIAVSGDFTQTDNCGTSLAPQGTCTISLAFTPTAAGYRTGGLTIIDSASTSPQAVTLSGAGIAPVTLSATTLYFSGTVVGRTSAAQNVTLTNNQNATAVSISSIATSGDFAQTNNCGASLAPLAKCIIAVTFTPTATGIRTGTLTVADSASNSPQTASLGGTGVAPVTLSPGTLYFFNIAVGSTSAAQNVTLTNNQNATAVSIGSIATSGDFAQTNNCGTSLAPLAKCTIALTFTPTATGTRTGTLTVTDSASNSPQTANLYGTAVAPVTLSPTALSFSSTAVGSTSAAKNVTLTNNQNAAAVGISSITTSGDYAQANNCGTSLAPLAKCTIAVTFTPTATGTRTGALTVSDSAGNSPQTASLGGTGVAPVTLSPGTVYFSNMAVGSTSAAQNMTLTNNQNATVVNISSIAASGDFAQTNNCGTSLAPLAKCTIAVTFAPTATGTRTGTLTVIDNATNSPQTANLAGSGVAQVMLSPGILFFSSTAVGSTSAAQNVTLTNNQNATAVSISGIVTSGDFAQTNNCGISLAPLAKCTIAVTFTPTATGTRTGTLTVSDSGSNSPQKVSLSGTGQ